MSVTQRLGRHARSARQARELMWPEGERPTLTDRRAAWASEGVFHAAALRRDGFETGGITTMMLGEAAEHARRARFLEDRQAALLRVSRARAGSPTGGFFSSARDASQALMLAAQAASCRARCERLAGPGSHFTLDTDGLMPPAVLLTRLAGAATRPAALHIRCLGPVGSYRDGEWRTDITVYPLATREPGANAARYAQATAEISLPAPSAAAFALPTDALRDTFDLDPADVAYTAHRMAGLEADVRGTFDMVLLVSPGQRPTALDECRLPELPRVLPPSTQAPTPAPLEPALASP